MARRYKLSAAIRRARSADPTFQKTAQAARRHAQEARWLVRLQALRSFRAAWRVALARNSPTTALPVTQSPPWAAAAGRRYRCYAHRPSSIKKHVPDLFPPYSRITKAVLAVLVHHHPRSLIMTHMCQAPLVWTYKTYLTPPPSIK